MKTIRDLKNFIATLGPELDEMPLVFVDPEVGPQLDARFEMIDVDIDAGSDCYEVWEGKPVPNWAVRTKVLAVKS